MAMYAGTDAGFRSPEVSMELMQNAHEHYTKHYEVVTRKLKHAQTATMSSLHQVKQATTQMENQRIASQEFDNLKVYEGLWDITLKAFNGNYIPESALERIENILSSLPRTIMKFYDILLGQDSVLQKLIADLSEDKYRQALNVIRKLQGGTCPVTGLSPEELECRDEAQLAQRTHESAIKIILKKKDYSSRR